MDRQLANELDKELWQMSQTNEIAKALAEAQGEMKNPGFDTTNPHFKSKFASLAAVRNSVIPVLAKHGIALVQDLATTEAGVACRTYLYHSSGQSLEFGPLVVPVDKPNAWGMGSAGTYAKRYSMQAVCGVVGDEDDDGNAAVSAAGNGWRDNSGRPDTSQVDPATAAAFAESFKTALVNADVNGIMEMHHQLRTEAELYTAVSDRLTSKQRSDLRKIISENKEAA